VRCGGLLALTYIPSPDDNIRLCITYVPTLLLTYVPGDHMDDLEFDQTQDDGLPVAERPRKRLKIA
jgi:hypothetical protein